LSDPPPEPKVQAPRRDGPTAFVTRSLRAFMPEVFDWQRVADPHAVVRYAVQSLHQGRTVAFPSETGYSLAASALVPRAVQQLPDDPPNGARQPLTLAVRGAAQARDWAPGMSPLTQRLARRLWPGPVTLRVSGALEQGLASRLSEEVRARLCVQGCLSLTSPGHEALREVLRRLPDPLVLAMPQSEASAASAEQIFAWAGERVDVILDAGPRPQGQSATVVAVHDDSWEVVRPGVVSAEQIREQTACLVLFLCTGNTCRSPLAEALCKKRLADRLGCAVEQLPARGYQVLSAGLAATRGAPAAVEGVQVARRYGADLSAHRSQPLTPELAARADYLIGMTRSHLHSLTDYFGPGGALRLLDPAGDIADPIGGDQPIYDVCGQQIWQHLESLVAEITKGASGQESGVREDKS
jgi:tRNA threonylcarbamoyl adenosine modification protein (Sua5/YciO/YrdC/YwlC family)